MDKKLSIRKFALQNAVKFEGRANPGAVIGKVVSESPELKKDMKSLAKEVSIIIKEVNKLGVEKQRAELEKTAPELLEEKPKEKKAGLKPLEGAEQGKVIMRFEPSPSGPLHIGHSYVVSLNSEYCRMYNGKLILRIADTNPENIYPQAYEMIPEDAKWITKGNIWKFVVQSDRMDIYYKYAEEIISKGFAYVCTCPAEAFREIKVKGIQCPCRELSVQENLKRWKKMFKEYKPGEAVVRIKTSMTHPNPAMRDWPAVRINEEEHARQKKKYRVWPLMNFSVAIDDHDLGVTHTVRAKEHMDNEKRQKFLYDHMGWKMATNIYVGRINFVGLEISKTKTKDKISKGVFKGWDDIRLPFIPSLKRRGYSPDAFINYALDVGITQNDKTITGDDFFTALNHFNTAVIEPSAHRYFFIDEPVEVEIEGTPAREIELDLHPENKKGGRKFKTGSKFYIASRDFKKLKDGKLYRLMDCINFVKKKSKLVFDSLEYEKYKDKGEMIMHWLPVSGNPVKVSVLMADGSERAGLGEEGMSELKKGAVIQMERFAFARLDSAEKGMLKFWFTHS